MNRAEKRMEICKQCPLYYEGPLGPICNPRKYLNEKDLTTTSDRPMLGYKRGCGCMLNRKVQNAESRCTVGKW